MDSLQQRKKWASPSKISSSLQWQLFETRCMGGRRLARPVSVAHLGGVARAAMAAHGVAVCLKTRAILSGHKRLKKVDDSSESPTNRNKNWGTEKFSRPKAPRSLCAS
jgi:hypothetical protein